MKHLKPIALLALFTTLTGCGPKNSPIDAPVPSAPESAALTPEAAADFVTQVDHDLRDIWVQESQAAWNYMTDITDEHEAVLTEASAQTMAYLSKTIPVAAEFSKVPDLDPSVARQLHLLSIASVLPAPKDGVKRNRLSSISTKLNGMYGTGEYCKGEDCRDLGALEAVMAESRDYDELLDAWTGWRTTSPPMRDMYTEFVALGNEGADEIGFSDLGALWRSGYDMTPEQTEAEADRLWMQVKPLYEQLQCHVRAKLEEHYGADKMGKKGTIPAHLTGNMWAQSWDNLYPMLEPFPGQPSIDVTEAIVAKGMDHVQMVKQAEGFFTSLGLKPLPSTFWERSLFLKPTDREVVCHASAWDVNYNDDLRIKMCIRPNMEDFITIHHELGHNYYYHYYYELPVLFQQGAHDGFHEGIGDTLALSITPNYLNSIGLLDETSDSDEAVINKQMQDALAKIAFLPFGRMIDQWRWDVFSGKITPENYNSAWWELRERYQGVSAPVERDESNFDPGAKYHIPANTPYLRYFFAHVLQFQFHKALCEASGHEGPLHTCSIYNSKEAGAKMQAMLEMGASQPWPDALQTVTGGRQMEAAPLVEYFQPLMGWLEVQNKDRECGWAVSGESE